ncbi:hypothetical protein BN126_989 [Cronobacter sakazakii 680]|nr:hypothetical protein BN126_989 [Cronobacter sakazakii 680]
MDPQGKCRLMRPWRREEQGGWCMKGEWRVRFAYPPCIGWRYK